MTNTANQIAATLNNDGQKYVLEDGRTLNEVVNGYPHSHQASVDGQTDRFEFADGSAILTSNDCWDVESAEAWVMECEA